MAGHGMKGEEIITERIMDHAASHRLPRGGESIACLLDGPADARPGVLWCGGYSSDMTGTKAEFVAQWARDSAARCVRFDYFGHGASSGAFTDGTIGHWRDDALAVLDQVAQGPQILVGSSMGGWIALLLAQARPERIASVVLIAPAPDFSERLIWNAMDADARETLARDGIWHQPPATPGDGPSPFTRRFIEEGRDHLILDAGVSLPCPVRILQGTADADVPWRHALDVAAAIDAPQVTLTLVRDGDHRLSSPADLERLRRVLGRALDESASLMESASARSPSR